MSWQPWKIEITTQYNPFPIAYIAVYRELFLPSEVMQLGTSCPKSRGNRERVGDGSQSRRVAR